MLLFVVEIIIMILAIILGLRTAGALGVVSSPLWHNSL